MKVNIITLGCSKNTVDSERILTQLAASGIKAEYDSSANGFDAVLINTCGFIEEAKQESVETILGWTRAKAEKKIGKVIVTGCLSERYRKDLINEIPEVDAYFGTHDLPDLLSYLGVKYRHDLPDERIISTPAHYAYLKISEGCNRGCSFCAIPLMRGPMKSIPIDALVKETKTLARKGTRELILIAQDLSAYGTDIYGRQKLSDLLLNLSGIEGIEWIRLHYAYPARFPLSALDVFYREPKLCRYLDMPLQHINDRLLSAMHRGINKKRTTELICRIREKVPGIYIRTSFMVGFPGETEREFEELLEFAEKMKFERMGVFTYSHEENTSAHSLPDDLSREEKKKRADALSAVHCSHSGEINRTMIGKSLRVLVDRKEGDFYSGRTQYDSPEVDNEVIVPAERQYLRVGDFSDIVITSASDFELTGVMKEVIQKKQPLC
ncbi:MAG: 30S ribosomal protein S12 methylthiotransferase RimO [Bacteroidetes bacterium]|nr:30S ribosomal protein S12 methylthiotransferase RimO [Bacteroidota bacterium]